MIQRKFKSVSGEEVVHHKNVLEEAKIGNSRNSSASHNGVTEEA